MDRFHKLHRTINKILEMLLVFIFSVLVLDVLWQVFTRYSFGKPSAFSEELARYLLVWLAILGTAYVRGYKGQMAIDYMFNKLSKSKQYLLSLFIEYSIMLFALVVMIIGGINLMYITLKLNQISPALNIPVGYIYSVVPISGFLILFFSIYHIKSLQLKNKSKI
ncbi:MAG: TRAP transporter small permease [Cellulophaga sp.]